jgi:hypothetical protein
LSDAVPEPLRSILESCFNVEVQGRDWIGYTRNVATSSGDGGRAFRRQFARAILHQSISPDDYYAVTQDPNYPTVAELYERLREVWAWLYDNAPITED